MDFFNVIFAQEPNKLGKIAESVSRYKRKNMYDTVVRKVVKGGRNSLWL